MSSPFTLDPKISAWINLVRRSGCTVKKIKPLSLIRRKDGKLLFALLETETRSPEGHELPNIVFIRGDACIIVPLLRNRETGEERFLMVRQRRTGNGEESLEFPAGMLDEETDDPLGAAVRELEEETGLKAGRGELFPLCGGKLFSSVGACDEGIFFFGCLKELDGAEWRSLQNRNSAGNHAENERISVLLIKREEAEKKVSSLQVRLGFYLFESHRR